MPRSVDNWPPSFRLRHLFIAIAIVAGYLSGMKWLLEWTRLPQIDVDVTQAKSIEIQSSELPHYLEMRVFGTIDGKATVIDPWGTKTTIGPGAFDLKAANEYYDTSAHIEYSPTNVRSGKLTVEYEFGT